MAVTRRPVYPQVPSEMTRTRGVHFPVETTSTSVSQGSLPTFANQVQTTVTTETVTLNFTYPPMLQGSTLTVRSNPVYLQEAGTVTLTATDTGKLIKTPPSPPTIADATTSISTSFSAVPRSQAPNSNVVKSAQFKKTGSKIGTDGTLLPSTVYTQIALTGILTIYALQNINAGSVSVPVTVSLSGGAVT